MHLTPLNKELIIGNTELFVKDYMKDYDCSHDYNHILRVKKLAIKIAKKEKLNDDDIFEVTLGALTHDIADHKYSNKETQEEALKTFFKPILPNSIMLSVIYIACNVSLSKEVQNIDRIDKNNIKLKCVQDADRIDSLGSVGIARYFIYGIIKKNSNMTDIITNIENRTEILLRFIKTKYAKKIAKKKHKIIKIYIKDFKKSI